MLYRVVTSERVAVTYRLAGLGSRFLAWLVDAGLIALFGLMGVATAAVLDIGREGLGTALALLWIFALQWGYFLAFEWLWTGQTPGKRVVGIRVIQDKGMAVSFVQAAVRNFVRVVDALPAFYALGFAAAAVSRHHRRLGDLAAGTLVVQVQGRARPVQPLPDMGGEAAEPAGPLEAAARARLARLDREQRQAILDLCLRRDQLPLRERVRMVHEVAAWCEQRLELPRPAGMSDEKLVLRLAAVIAGTAARAAAAGGAVGAQQPVGRPA